MDLHLHDGSRGFGFGGLGFDAAPAYGAALDGFFDGAEKDDVHHLAIVEALDDEGEKERPVFVFLEGEGDDARGNSELSSGNTQGNRKMPDQKLHGRCGVGNAAGKFLHPTAK